MKILRYTFIFLLTFYGGLLASEFSYDATTLGEITADIKFYDGRFVEIRTYAQLDSFDGSWTAGEQWEKLEASTFLELEHEPLHLREQLTQNISLSAYNRVEVILRGRVRDNCVGGLTCCFGNSLTIVDATIDPLGTIEYYSRPDMNR